MLLFQQLLLTLLLYVSPHHGIADANKDGHDILEKKGHDGGLLATTPNDKDSLVSSLCKSECGTLDNKCLMNRTFCLF